MLRDSQTRRWRLLSATMLLFAAATVAAAQTTAFTYQGRLTDSGNPANGNYDLQFALFDSSSGGAQIGSTQTLNTVSVSGGVFTVQLDFGVNAFPGANRFLEIAVRPSGGGSFTTLSPRQQISSTPYSIRTLSATTADGLSNACVACVQDSQINQVAGNKVNGTIPVASVPSGSSSYVQNTTTQQSSANFNISGSGTAGSMNVNGPFSFGGIGGPAVAPAGQGRIYFDLASSKLKVSESGGSFVNLVGSGGVSGSGTTNKLPLWSAGTTLGDSVITQSNNNVGIGTTAPSSLLHLRKDVPAGLGPTLSLFNGGGSGGAANSIDFFTYSAPMPNGPSARIMSIDDGVFSNHLTFSTRDPGSNSNGLTERMRITSDGNVSQPPAANGLVKAMLLVIGDGSINFCYNSQLAGSAATTPPCGLRVSRDGNTVYYIDFPFHVGSRFISATIENGSGSISVYPFQQTITVFTEAAHPNFYLIVF